MHINFKVCRLLLIILSIFAAVFIHSTTSYVHADHGPEHTHPGQALGVNGELSVSPRIIVNKGVANYTYTGEGYPSWDRFRGFHSLYYTAPFGIGFRPVRWGTINLDHNCDVGAKNCSVEVEVEREEGVTFRGEFLPNCRGQYYLGPFPETDAGGSRANSRIALYVRGTDLNFNVQLINPLTVTSTGRLPDCPDKDFDFEPVEPSFDFNCDVINSDVFIEPDTDVSGRIIFEAEVYDFCQTYIDDFGDEAFCDPNIDPDQQPGCDDPVYECIIQTDIDWDFGDGTTDTSSGFDEGYITHDYTEAGDFTVTSFLNSPFGGFDGAICQLSLNPPSVIVEVDPIGADKVIIPASVPGAKAFDLKVSQGDLFEVKVDITTTDGFGVVEDVSFLNPELLDTDGEKLTVMTAPELPTVPANYQPNQTILSDTFIVEAIGDGLSIIDAPVAYTFLSEEVIKGDAEEIVVEAALDVQVDATVGSAGNSGSNTATLEITVENKTDDLTFTDIEFEDLPGLSIQTVPNSTNSLGSVSLLQGLAPALPSTLAPGDSFTGRLVVVAVQDGDLRLATTIIATDEESNIYKKSKGADLRIVDGEISNNRENKAISGYINAQLDNMQAEIDELESDVASVLNTIFEDINNGLGPSAAVAGASSACGVDGPGDNRQGEPTEIQRDLADVNFLPETVANWISEEAEDNNPIALYYLYQLGEAKARSDFGDDQLQGIADLGNLLYSLKDEEVRDKYSNEIVKFKDEIIDAGGILIEEAFTQEGREKFEQTYLDAHYDIGVAACTKVINKVEETQQLLVEGKYDQFIFDIAQTKESASLEISKEVILEFTGASVANKTLRAVKNNPITQAVTRQYDSAKTAVRQRTRGWQEKVNRVRGKTTPVNDNPVPKGGMDTLNKDRVTHDRVDSDELDGTVATSTLIDGPEFDGFIGGISPEDQVKIQNVLSDLEVENGLDPGSLSLEVTPTNPYASPGYRARNGLEIVTPKEEVWKAKAISYDDFLLGAPQEHLGALGVYKPDLNKFKALPPSEQNRLYSRFKKQQKNWEQANWEPKGTQIIDGNIVRVDANGKPKPKLKQNMELATQEAGHTFTEKFPGEEFERQIFQKVELERVKPSADASEAIIWRDRNRPPIDPSKPYDPITNPRPRFGGDMDGADFRISGLENYPDHVRRNLRNKLDLEILPRLRKEGLPFAQHHITRRGIDFATKDQEFMAELIIERLPPAEGRKAYMEYLDLKNRKNLLLAQRENPSITEQDLRDAGIWVDFADEEAKLEFGVKLTRITSNNVKIVEGKGNPLTGLRKTYEIKYNLENL